MDGLIESGHTWLVPLQEFRNKLYETTLPENKHKFRHDKRRSGKVTVIVGEDKQAKKIFGPYRMEVRKDFLRKLLAAQKAIVKDTSVYAGPDEGVIRYRVVDEYAGDTLTGVTERVSEKPLTLGEFSDFFLNAWPLLDVLEMNFEDDLDGRLRFFTADSDFYPDFDLLCRQRVVAGFAKQ